MNASLYELALYAGGMAALWTVPGPVWVALTARALTGGFKSAWPLAVGVALGDMFWPTCAILGLTWIESVYGDFLSVLRWVAAAVFLAMGILLVRKPDAALSADSRMTRPGLWSAFSVGLLAIVGNPKAILFYMGALPGFFDVGNLTALDMVVIALISGGVPMIGNLLLSLFLDRARALLSSPAAIHRMNVGAGVLLIAVGLVIPFI